jgi:16S rRNA (adenine1518-N6/adenine1519-N6)-dimethyltransferase
MAQRLVEMYQIQPGQRVLEIGPGTGALTEFLLAAGCRLTAVERDPECVACLRDRWPGLDLIQDDILNTRLVTLDEATSDWVVVGNLPYYISTPILTWTENQIHRLRQAFYMVQWEVAQRLTASAGSKAYGAMTCALGLVAEIKVLMKLPRSAFNPSPQVDSAVIQITPSTQYPLTPSERKALVGLIRKAFQHRRKKFVKAISGGKNPDSKTLQRLQFVCVRGGLDPERRPDQIHLNEYYQFFKALSHDPLTSSGDIIMDDDPSQ